jgi:cysteine desulfurase
VPPSTIYLDNNSTTPIDPRVIDAMTRAWRDFGANPASQHSLGRQARRALENAREGILDLLGAKAGSLDSDRLIFTSGGTEANNLAVFGLTRLARIPSDRLTASHTPPEVMISGLEHPSITAPVAELSQRGVQVSDCYVLPSGEIDAELLLEPHQYKPTVLLSLLLANNETGVIQPVADIAAISSGHFRMHTDATQAVGKIPVHFRQLGVHAMTVAPHKFHGPLGIGALILRYEFSVQPQLFGGFQQGGFRPGTENVALAVGFHTALKLALDELPERATQMQSLRNQLEQLLCSEFTDMVIIGQNASRLPNTSCLSFPGLDRQALVIALDLAGVACSTGSACASGSSEPSPTLVVMRLPSDVIQGAIRLSLSAFTTAEEVAEAARRIISTVKHLRGRK